MNEGAYLLARLRAGGGSSAADWPSASAAAATCGRRIVDAGGTPVLSWLDGLSPSADLVELRGLSRAKAAVAAIVLAECWPDADLPPWPGEPVRRDDVLATASRLGVDRNHAAGFLDVEAPMLQLWTVADGIVSLGLAVAAWTSSQVDAVRRRHRHLVGAVAQ